MALTWIDYTGLGIIILTMVMVILNVNALTRSYRENKNVGTLYLDMTFIFFAFAIVLLLAEKVLLSAHETNPIYTLEILIRWSASLALITSGCAILFINVFAFQNTYPERKIGLSILIGILITLYVGLLVYSCLEPYFVPGGILASVEAGEITYVPFISTWSLVFLIPVTIGGPAVFFYFSYMTRESNPPNSKRSFWMGFAITSFFIGYIIEVLPIQHFIVEFLSIFGRGFMFLAALILYICFTMPDWFKNSIGWTED